MQTLKEDCGEERSKLAVPLAKLSMGCFFQFDIMCIYFEDATLKLGFVKIKLEKQDPILRYLVSFLVGAIVLSTFSLLQKRMLGILDIFVWKGFITPVVFGGTTGLVLMWLYARLWNVADRLQQSQEKLQDFLDNASDLIQSVDTQGRFTYVNAAWLKTMKYDQEDLEKLTVFDVIHPDWRAHCRSVFEKILGGEQVSHVETVFVAKDGTDVYLAGNLNFRMENGVPVSTRGIFRNITSQRKALEKERLTAKVFENAQEAVLVTDPRGMIVTVNNAFTSITGFTAAEVIGEMVYRVLSPGEKQPDEGYLEAMSAHPMNWEGELLGRRKNGETFPMRVAISLIRDEVGQITNYVGLFSDITDRKQFETRLEHLATHDFLTDLPNRALFQKRLEESILSARHEGKMLAVLFLDLDAFKEVNDRFGHDFGDQLMQRMTARLKDCVRKTDLVARMGGDEFAILVGDISDVAQAAQIAQKIINNMRYPHAIMGKQVETTVSIGISTYPKSRDAHTLLIDADFAMYQAKQSGKNTFYTF
jgi:diguanylate cyclase (GGDEF)-like protein/PAS domain S-box-containing protein